jgi:two-component system NtrC family sensor kinase
MNTTAATHHPSEERDRLMDRALMTAFFNNIPDSVYFKDKQSRFIQLSTSCYRRLGKSCAGDIIGKTDFDFFEKSRAQQAFDDEQRIIRTGEPVFKKLEKEVWPDGSTSWVITNKLPLRNEHGDIIGTFGFSRDVTKAKELELEVERANQELLLTSRAAGKAEMAISVLHNVGNVLNSVNVSASVVANTLHHSKAGSVVKLAQLIATHRDNLGTFLTEDSKGRKVPELMLSLGQYFCEERNHLLQELQGLQQNIDHIKKIVSMQQTAATSTGDDNALTVAKT